MSIALKVSAVRSLTGGRLVAGRAHRPTRSGKSADRTQLAKRLNSLCFIDLSANSGMLAAKNEANCRGCLTVDRDDRSKSVVLQNRRKDMQRTDGQSCSPLFLSRPSAGPGFLLGWRA